MSSPPPSLRGRAAALPTSREWGFPRAVGGKLALCLRATGVLGVRLSLGVLSMATWACSASKPSGQTLCPTRPHTHQQGDGHLGGERPRLHTRSPASCARSCRPPRHSLPSATSEMGRIPQEKPGRFQPPERGSRSSALPLSSAGWLGGGQVRALTAWPPAERVHMAKTEWGRALSSRGGGGQEPAGCLLCCESSFNLHASPGSR